jgi:hypothetical protein
MTKVVSDFHFENYSSALSLDFSGLLTMPQRLTIGTNIAFL